MMTLPPLEHLKEDLGEKLGMAPDRDELAAEVLLFEEENDLTSTGAKSVYLLRIAKALEGILKQLEKIEKYLMPNSPLCK